LVKTETLPVNVTSDTEIENEFLENMKKESRKAGTGMIVPRRRDPGADFQPAESETALRKERLNAFYF
jgi:hypothetical protein